jgi:hypothetical protein
MYYKICDLTSCGIDDYYNILFCYFVRIILYICFSILIHGEMWKY